MKKIVNELKRFAVLTDGENYADLALVIAFWLVLIIGGMFTVRSVAVYYLAIKPIVSYWIAAIVVGIIVLATVSAMVYWIVDLIKHGQWN